MSPSDYKFSNVITFGENKFSYVIITRANQSGFIPPDREDSHALHVILHEISDGEICECMEGYFESKLDPDQVFTILSRNKFVHDPTLDQYFDYLKSVME